MPEFGVVAGQVLREVRLRRSLSLRQVMVRSSGRFKPSSVASYERGERQISLERLFALADVYEIAPERIVAAIVFRLERAHRPALEEKEPTPDPLVVLDPFDSPTRRR